MEVLARRGGPSSCDELRETLVLQCGLHVARLVLVGARADAFGPDHQVVPERQKARALACEEYSPLASPCVYARSRSAAHSGS